MAAFSSRARSGSGILSSRAPAGARPAIQGGVGRSRDPNILEGLAQNLASYTPTLLQL